MVEIVNRAFLPEPSPDTSEFEDDVDASMDFAVSAPLSNSHRGASSASASKEALLAKVCPYHLLQHSAWLTNTSQALRDLQLEQENSRRRELALQQQVNSLQYTHHSATVSGRSHTSNLTSRPALATVSAAGPLPAATHVVSSPSELTSGNDQPTARNANPHMAAIPDDDPGKPMYELYARKTAMLEVLFPTHEDFRRPLPDFARDSPRRFLTKESCAQGLTADIYATFPPACHAGLRNHYGVQKAVSLVLTYIHRHRHSFQVLP